MLDGTVDLLAVSWLSTKSLLLSETLSTSQWLLLTSESLLSNDTLTTDGLLLTSSGESLTWGLSGRAGQIVALSGDGRMTTDNTGSGGTSGANGACSVSGSVVVAGGTSDSASGGSRLGLGGEASELALSVDAVLMLLHPVSLVYQRKDRWTDSSLRLGKPCCGQPWPAQ